MKVQMSGIATIAGKEFWDHVRNRWVLALAVVFTAFALSIAYFGTAHQGAVGFRGIELTLASLVSLVIYLVPLTALILGFDAVVGERERGSLDLLLSMPITRLELLLGKYLGLAAALAFSTIAGFGSVALILSWQIDTRGLLHYAGFMASTVLLGMSFLSLAVMVSVISRDRARAGGAAIALWLFLVLVFDLLLLAALVASGGEVGGEIGRNAFPYLLLLNPADVFRILNIFRMEEVRTLYGLATVVPESLADPWLLGAVMLGWIAVPLVIALWRFR